MMHDRLWARWLGSAGRIGVLTVAVAVTTGCNPGSKSGQDIRLVPVASPYERDIPIPDGFTLVEDACEDQLTGTRRLYLRHLYEGEADKYRVRKFYREQMPRAQWALVSDGNIKGQYTMRFEKNNEACTVQIQDAGGRIGHKIHIQVIIMQEERGSPPSVAKTE
jgi:hypothetical protein